MKRLLLIIFSFSPLFALFLPFTTHSENSFQLIPAAQTEENKDKADALAEKLLEVPPEKSFWDEYNKGAKDLQGDLGAQIRAGVFSRNSVLQIGVYILRFVMQLALVIGSAMLIWSGYTYTLVAIGAKDKPEEATKAIKNAIIGLFVISISYTLIKLLQMAFLS